jgi:cytochrome b561
MTRSEASRRYSGVAIALHWAMAFSIVGMIVVGWNMSDMERGALKQSLYQMHKSFGITLLFLTVARILWRLMNPPPPQPEGMKPLERGASHIVHMGFYALMIAMPLSGWAMVSLSTFKVPTVLFGVLSWPHLPGLEALASKDTHEMAEFIHSKLAWLALGLLVLHVIGAIKHELGPEEGVFKRMIPGLFGSTAAPMPPPRGFVLAFGSAIALFAAIAAVPLVLSAQPASALPVADAAPREDAGPVVPATPASTSATAWEVDLAASEIAFAGTHEGNDFAGSFRRWNADIAFNPDAPETLKADVEVDTASALTGTKLYDDSLRQSEWFSVKNHPVARVTLRGARASATGFVADAVLSIKGVEVTVPFTFVLNPDGARTVMTGEATLSRKALNLGMESDPTADWVGDAVTVRVRVTATPRPGG